MNVIFDLDDTLYPEIDYVKSGYQAVDIWAADHMGLDGFGDACWQAFLRGNRARVFDAVLSHAQVDASPALIGDLVEVYRSHIPIISLYDDAASALLGLNEKYRLGLISDGFAVAQRRKLEALEIGQLFRSTVITDELGEGREFWKPSPVPYQLTMESMNGDANTFVYIADNDRKDFVSANRLGWHTIKVIRSGSVHESAEVGEEYRAHHEISSLWEIDALLENLMG